MKEKNYIVVRDDDFILDVTYSGSIDTSAYTFTLTVKEKECDDAAVFTTSTTGSVSGSCTLTIPNETTATLELVKYSYRLKRVNDVGSPKTLMGGDLIIEN